MKTAQIILFSSILLSILVACDPTPNRENTTEVAEEQNEEMLEDTPNEDQAEDEAEFLVQYASANLMMVQMSEMAAQQATSPDVKSFAQEVKNNHQGTLDEITSLANNKNYTIPNAPGDAEQRKIDQLRDYEGIDFDEAYLGYVEEMHENYQDELKAAAENEFSADIKTFADNSLTQLKTMHQKTKSMAEVLEQTEEAMEE